MPSTVLGIVSTSSSVQDQREISLDSHYQWESLKKFLYIAEAFTAINYNFNSFSGRKDGDSIYSFVVLALTFGMPYMYMEFFIKQYTGRIAFNEDLNPLLKGVNYVAMLVTGLHCVMHAYDSSSALAYFFATFNTIPPWSECLKNYNEQCIPTKNISVYCTSGNIINTDTKLSSYLYFKAHFLTPDSTIITQTTFLIAVAWVCNFFLCTISEQMLIKIFYVSWLLRNVSLVISTTYVFTSNYEIGIKAFLDILTFRFEDCDITSMHNTEKYLYGIGLIGVYDFGSMSPFTIIDSAVILYTLMVFVQTLLRVVLLKTMQRIVHGCVMLRKDTNHFFAFCGMPTSSDFFLYQRMFTMNFYFTMLSALAIHITAVTATMIRLLRSDFTKVKAIYVNGVICFIGFVSTLLLSLNFPYRYQLGVTLHLLMVYVSIFKSLLIAYVYGVDRFSADIHFWLGYKPIKYWLISWSIMPIVLVWMAHRTVIKAVRDFIQNQTKDMVKSFPVILAGFIIAIGTIIQIRTIVKFIIADKIASLFRPSPKYGPLDPDERRRRKRFDETTSVRKCTHTCIMLDDKFDCNHKPVSYMLIAEDVFTLLSGEASEMQLFDLEPAPARVKKPKTS